MKIFKAKTDDLETILKIVQTTINEIYPRFYPDDVVRFFLNYHSRENIRNAFNDEKVLLIDVDGNTVGTGALYKNEIKRMFVLPQYQGKGYGTKLIEKLEQTAIDDGNEVVVLAASLPAYSLYQKRGYVPVKYNKVVTEKGQVLCYHEMQKALFNFSSLTDAGNKKAGAGVPHATGSSQ